MAKSDFFTREITLTMPTWATLALVGTASILVIWFILAPGWRAEIIFITSILAGLGVFLNAINGIFTRHVQAELSRESLRQSRTHEALDMMKRWNDPDFGKIRHDIAPAIEANERFVRPGEVTEARIKVNFILNFLEMVAVGCQTGEVDQTLCKLFFRASVIFFSKRLGWYIEECRKAHNQPSAWENLEKLAVAWKD